MPDEHGDAIPPNNDPNEYISPLSDDEQALFDAARQDLESMPSSNVGSEVPEEKGRAIDPMDAKRTINDDEEAEWGTPPHRK